MLEANMEMKDKNTKENFRRPRKLLETKLDCKKLTKAVDS